MESLNFTKHLNTSDETEALRDMARLYERMVMRRHTNGGYHNVVTELWRRCEAWNTGIVIMGSTSRARTWLPFRVCSTSRAASWVCT